MKTTLRHIKVNGSIGFTNPTAFTLFDGHFFKILLKITSPMTIPITMAINSPLLMVSIFILCATSGCDEFGPDPFRLAHT